MKIDKEIELFEAAYCKIQMIDDGGMGDTFDKYPDGRYIRHSLNISWLMWQASANREGYKLVPVEPTKEMLDAQDYIRDESAIEIYKSMIGA